MHRSSYIHIVISCSHYIKCKFRIGILDQTHWCMSCSNSPISLACFKYFGRLSQTFVPSYRNEFIPKVVVCTIDRINLHPPRNQYGCSWTYVNAFLRELGLISILVVVIVIWPVINIGLFFWFKTTVQDPVWPLRWDHIPKYHFSFFTAPLYTIVDPVG